MEIRVHKPEDLKGSMLLIGFPSRGLVGGVAANFVIDELKMWQIASLHDPRLPPTMIVRDGVGFSPIQFYVSAERCGPDGTCDKLVACLSEVPFDTNLLGEVAWTIMKWAKDNGVAHVVVLEGVESTTPGKPAARNGKDRAPMIRGVRSLSSKQQLAKYKIPKVTEGVVSGYA
ncbi:MAG: PAC2 family protein, partial [Euryarchaeota archaeon]|nr:PAC2 family protein [Euryarchaeota archaeon]